MLDGIANGDASYRPPTCRMSAGGSYHLKHDPCPFNESLEDIPKSQSFFHLSPTTSFPHDILLRGHIKASAPKYAVKIPDGRNMTDEER